MDVQRFHEVLAGIDEPGADVPGGLHAPLLAVSAALRGNRKTAKGSCLYG